MPAKKYKVTLETHEREYLHQLILRGKAAARKLTHARTFLACEESDEERGASDTEVARAVHVSQPTVERVHKAFVDSVVIKYWPIISSIEFAPPRQMNRYFLHNVSQFPATA